MYHSPSLGVSHVPLRYLVNFNRYFWTALTSIFNKVDFIPIHSVLAHNLYSRNSNVLCVETLIWSVASFFRSGGSVGTYMILMKVLSQSLVLCRNIHDLNEGFISKLVHKPQNETILPNGSSRNPQPLARGCLVGVSSSSTRKDKQLEKAL